MRGILRFWVPFLALAVLASTGPAHALGLGIYADFGSGGGTWTFTDEFTDAEFDEDAGWATADFGFVLDTNVAKDKLFNYRFKAGLTSLESDLDNQPNSFEVGGIIFEHLFGFGVLRTEKVRLWIGPSLRTGFYGGYFKDRGRRVGDSAIVAIGGALVIGANFILGETFTVAVDGGFRSLIAGGVIDSYGLNIIETDAVGGFTGPYLGVALIFRLGQDHY